MPPSIATPLSSGPAGSGVGAARCDASRTGLAGEDRGLDSDGSCARQGSRESGC